MPPSEPVKDESWIRSDQLILPRQILSAGDAGAFLEFLFRDVAIKPTPLKLKQTARVARYLRALVLEMPAGREREMLDRLSEIIWLTLLDRGPIQVAEKGEAINFLREHSKTYLNSFDTNRILEIVQNLDIPTKFVFRPPQLMARGRSVQGSGKAQLQDDLTERMYVAYYALQRATVKNVRTEIAKTLNRIGLKTRAGRGTDQAWGPEEVIERVRQFEDRLVRTHRLVESPDRHQQIERLRDMLVNSWIHGFHFARQVEAAARTDNQKA